MLRKLWVAALILLAGISLASAASVQLEAGGRSVAVQCVDNTLRLVAPIPGPGMAAGRAVALILEAPNTEPRILVGTAETSPEGIYFSSSGGAAELPFAAFLKEQPLTISRLQDSYTVASQGRARDVGMVVRECGVSPPSVVPPSIAIPKGAFREVQADLSLEGDRRWIVLASRDTPEEAFALVQTHVQNFPKAQVVRASNNRYAVVAGPERVGDGAAFKKKLVEKGAPSDTFLSQGQRFVAKVVPQSAPGCRTTGALNLRDKPRGAVLVELEQGQRLVVEDRRKDDGGNEWLRIKAEPRLSGWVFGSYVSCD
jgi:hypothetical protein